MKKPGSYSLICIAWLTLFLHDIIPHSHDISHAFSDIFHGLFQHSHPDSNDHDGSSKNHVIGHTICDYILVQGNDFRDIKLDIEDCDQHSMPHELTPSLESEFVYTEFLIPPLIQQKLRYLHSYTLTLVFSAANLRGPPTL